MAAWVHGSRQARGRGTMAREEALDGSRTVAAGAAASLPFRERLADWIAAERGPGRLLPWLQPRCCILGICLRVGGDCAEKCHFNGIIPRPTLAKHCALNATASVASLMPKRRAGSGYCKITDTWLKASKPSPTGTIVDYFEPSGTGFGGGCPTPGGPLCWLPASIPQKTRPGGHWAVIHGWLRAPGRRPNTGGNCWRRARIPPASRLRKPSGGPWSKPRRSTGLRGMALQGPVAQCKNVERDVRAVYFPLWRGRSMKDATETASDVCDVVELKHRP